MFDNPQMEQFRNKLIKHFPAQENAPRQAKPSPGSNLDNDKIKNLINILNRCKGNNQAQRTGEASPISQISRNKMNLLQDPKNLFSQHMKNSISNNYMPKSTFQKKFFENNARVTEHSGTPSEHGRAND